LQIAEIVPETFGLSFPSKYPRFSKSQNSGATILNSPPFSGKLTPKLISFPSIFIFPLASIILETGVVTWGATVGVGIKGVGVTAIVGCSFSVKNRTQY